jgi:hypothetical protein
MRDRRKRTAWLPRTIVVDTADEACRSLVRELESDGYDAISTASTDFACALVEAGQIDILFINVSAFPAESLRQVGRALSARQGVKLIAMALLMTAERVHDSPPVRTSAGPASARVGLAARWFYLPASHPSSLGPRMLLPN